MTQNRRIAINFLATYGRSVFALVCGLFTGRWLLLGLGEVDYGLFGVVGGLTAFIVFFNNLMATSVSRYYAFNVGRAKTAENPGEGIELCRKWFTTAIVVHTVIPVALILIGYPIGAWAVKSFLTIPMDRVQACVWVWRFACVGCFFAMITVPFSAMYAAKQEIAELTVYSFVQTSVNVVFMYYVVTHPGDWLARYSCWSCLINVMPQIVLSVRAVFVYPECRFRFAYIKSKERFVELLSFASLRFAGAIAGILTTQGQAIITNKFLGPARNAAMTVGSSLSAHSETLAAAMDGALGPAITNAAGEGNFEMMRSLCFRACKFSAVLMLVFALPLSLEVLEVMRLWLKNPPEYAGALCVCFLICLVLDKLTCGHWMSIFALGHIGWYQFWIGVAGVVTIPISISLLLFGCDLLAVGIAMIIGRCLYVVVRLYYGKVIGGMSCNRWGYGVLLPLLAVSLVSILPGILSCWLLPPSFLRVVITTGLVEVVFLPTVFFIVLSKEERSYFVNKIAVRFPIFKKLISNDVK